MPERDKVKTLRDSKEVDKSRTDQKMSSTASTEGTLDVPSPVRGEIVVSLSAAFGRHLWLRERTERAKRAVGMWWSRDEAYKGDCGCRGLGHRVS